MACVKFSLIRAFCRSTLTSIEIADCTIDCVTGIGNAIQALGHSANTAAGQLAKMANFCHFN